jgi:hypothetical protein
MASQALRALRLWWLTHFGTLRRCPSVRGSFYLLNFIPYLVRSSFSCSCVLKEARPNRLRPTGKERILPTSCLITKKRFPVPGNCSNPRSGPLWWNW